MFKRSIGFRVGLLVLWMISADLRSVNADGLPPEEALPTVEAEEEALLPEEMAQAETVAEEIAAEEPLSEEPAGEEPVAVESIPEPSPKPLQKPAQPVQKEPALSAAAVKAPKTDLWSTAFHGTILSETKPDGKIIGSVDQKSMLGEGDTIFLLSFNEEFVPGKEWVVYKAIKNVYHPKTGEYLGELIDVKGIVKVTETDKKLATAQIVRSKEPIFKADQIALVETLFNPADPAGRSLPEGMTATVVEARDNRINSALLDIVYIDRGKKDGVIPGDRFDVISGGQITGIHSDGQALHFPEREVGNILILSSQDHTATAQILKSSEPISKGTPLLFHFLK